MASPAILPSNPPANSFCFAPLHNSPPRTDKSGVQHVQHDATGAFLPYMDAYKKLYSSRGAVTTLRFTAKTEITHKINVAPDKLDAVVYFGHGWPTAMLSAHIDNDHIPQFAHLIRANCSPGVKIILYACLCGKVSAPGGCFASRLASALADMQAVVFAHDNAGHTTTNPNIYRFTGNSPAVPLAPPGMFHSFNMMLKAESIDKNPRSNNAFWARMPFMTDDEIADEVKNYKRR